MWNMLHIVVCCRVFRSSLFVLVISTVDGTIVNLSMMPTAKAMAPLPKAVSRQGSPPAVRPGSPLGSPPPAKRARLPLQPNVLIVPGRVLPQPEEAWQNLVIICKVVWSCGFPYLNQ